MKIILNNSKLVFGVGAHIISPSWTEPTGTTALMNTTQSIGATIKTQTAGAATWKYCKYSISSGKLYDVTTSVRGNYAPSDGLCWAFFTDSEGIIKGAFVRVMSSDATGNKKDSMIAPSGATTLHVFAFHNTDSLRNIVVTES